MEKRKKYGTLHNVTYVLHNTWNWERPIVFFLLIQAIIGVCTPFISIYMPSVILSGVTGEISLQTLLIVVGALSLVFALCNIAKEYIRAVNETHLTNNKIFYLTEIFKKKMMMDYQFVESEYGQNKFQDVSNILFNDSSGVRFAADLGHLFGAGTRYCSIYRDYFNAQSLDSTCTYGDVRTIPSCIMAC